ncbi:MAG: transglycosylase SLT domain-containing protein [Bacteriovoracia bacterium]
MPYVFLLIVAIGVLTYTKGDEIMDSTAPYTPAWNKYDAWFKYYASVNGLPSAGWKWLKALALNESSLGQNPLVIAGKWSSDGLSRGLMQLTVTTANDYEKWVPSVANLRNVNSADYDPDQYAELGYLLDDDETSIRIAAKHFARIYRKFNNLEYGVKAYNQGEGNQAKEIAYRAAGGVGKYEAAQTYWERFQRNLASVEAKP